MADKNKLEVVLSLMDKATAPLQAFSKRIEKLQEPVRKVSNKLAVFGQAAGFGKLRDAAGNVGSAFGNVASEAGALAAKVMAGVGLIGGGLAFLVKRTIDSIDAFDDLSVKAGVSAEFMQKAAYAAKSAGVGQDELGAAMMKMNQNITGAITGSKELQVWFRRAGLSMKDLKTMRPEQVFERVMAALAKLPQDSAKAGSLAAALLGKAGGQLLPMAGDFEKLTAEAERLGVVVSGDGVKAAAEFNDTLDRTMAAIEGVAKGIAVMLLPTLQEVATTVQDWVIANRDLIKTKVAEWIARLRENWPAIKQGALDAWAAIEKFGRGVSWFVDTVGGVGNTLLIVAGVMSGPLILALAAATKAVAAFGLALLSTPVGWIIGGIALIAGAVYLIYKNWDGITKWFSDLWAGLKQVFFDGIDDALAILRALDPIPIIAKAWEPLKNYFSGLWDDISKVFTEQIDKITGMLKKLDPTQYVKKAWDWATGGGEEETPQDPMRNSVMQNVSLGAPAGVSARAVETAQSRLFGGGAGGVQTNNAKVEVDFRNVPRGVEVTPGSNNTAPLDLSMGYAMVTP